jgi:hypothetical protein
MNKGLIEKEIMECKYRLKEFESKGLDLYLNSPHRDLLRKWIKEKLEGDIEFFKKRLGEVNL